MSSDNSSECQLKQRIPEEDKISSSSGVGDDSDNDRREDSSTVDERTTWQNVKYYFNRFRYYHFLVVDTLDKYASALCLWVLNLYLRLFMGVGPSAPSVLNDVDE